MTAETLPFYVSYVKMMDVERPKFPCDIRAIVGGEWVEFLGPDRILLQYRDRGVDVEETGGYNPNSSNIFTQAAYDRSFSQTPVHPFGLGIYVLHDRAVDIFEDHKMGRNMFLSLDTPHKIVQGPQGPIVCRGVTAIKVKERWPTLVPTHEAFHLDPKPEYPIFDFEKYDTSIRDRAKFSNLQLFGYDQLKWQLPCFNEAPDVDLWVDPFWSDSVFMSARLVEALDREGLLQGEAYGWNVRPCRSASPIEREHDLIPQKVRAVEPKVVSNMTLPEFRNLCEPIPLPLTPKDKPGSS